MLETWLQYIQPEQYPWLWQVFTIILATLLTSYATRLVLKQLEIQFRKTHNLWDDALLAAAARPATWMIWLVGFSYALQIILATQQESVFELVEKVRSLLVIGVLTWFLVSVIRQIETRLLSGEYTADRERPVDQTSVMAIGKLLRTAVIITAVLVVLQTLGYSISGVLAFGGIGGIAVGFAAKDLLANFFGGLMVHLDRPFAVGDWVRSPDKEIEGTVEYIGWRQTRIRTFDKRPLYVPNATFAQISVENPSRMSNRRIYETVGVRYDDSRQVAAIVAEVKAMLREHPAIDQQQTMIVNFNKFGASSLDFFVYTFTKTTNWVEFHEIKQDVLLKILEIVHRNGADVAFPTTTVKLDQEMLAAAEAAS